MAYSSGFSPHPRISYANASPTGAATEAEYLELGLAEVCDPAKLMAALNEVLPPGMVILAVGPGGGPSLADLLQASRWRIVLPEAEPDVLKEAVAALLGRSSVEVERMTKSGIRSFDARAAIIALEAEGTSLELLSRQETPLVRPDDVVNALKQIEPRLAGVGPALLTRLEQGPFADGVLGDPLANQQPGERLS